MKKKIILGFRSLNSERASAGVNMQVIGMEPKIDPLMIRLFASRVIEVTSIRVDLSRLLNFMDPAIGLFCRQKKNRG
jgi:hypothetical protein